MRKRVQKAYGGAFGALEHFGQMISAFARVADVDGNPNPNPDPDPDPSPSPSPNPNPNQALAACDEAMRSAPPGSDLRKVYWLGLGLGLG